MNDAVAFADAATTLHRIGREIINEQDSRSAALIDACQELLEKCEDLFRAEICAIFLVRDGEAVLEAHRGYTHPYGTPIPFDTLRKELRYKITSPAHAPAAQFDGITGWVASTGQEFSAQTWEEVKSHGFHAGKPDRLKIWDESRPFRGMFAVPLKLHGKTRGVLKVENKRGPEEVGATFDDTDRHLMRTLAEIFSVAVQNIYSPPDVQADYQWEVRIPSASDDIGLGERARKFDHCDMAKVIEELPTQIDVALEQGMPQIPEGPFEKVALVGVGGSALAADLVNDAFADLLSAPIAISRTYTIAPPPDKHTLVIASSFSGDTEEVIHAIESFPAHAPNLIAVSADGELLSLGRRKSFPVIQIPKRREPRGFQARSALGYTVTFLARLLHHIGLLDDPRATLRALPRFLREANIRTDAEEAAMWLRNKIPVVYTDEAHVLSIARVAKIKFNENAKRPALYNVLPETNHNEMIGFGKAMARFGIVYLHDPASHPRIRRRFNVMKRVFERETLQHISFWEWRIPGDTNIERVFAALLFADWCSYTLALLDGLDPTPVALVENFKEVLLAQDES
jgi:glucose/mannose-6-phosphate isomerase